MTNATSVILDGDTHDITIHYKAAIRDYRGLELSEPIIVMSIKQDGKHSPWVDVKSVLDIEGKYKQDLIDTIDPDFIPNQHEAGD